MPSPAFGLTCARMTLLQQPCNHPQPPVTPFLLTPILHPPLPPPPAFDALYRVARKVSIHGRSVATGAYPRTVTASRALVPQPHYTPESKKEKGEHHCSPSLSHHDDLFEI